MANRLMIGITSAVVLGAILGVVSYRYNFTEDQSFLLAVVLSTAILYITRNVE